MRTMKIGKSGIEASVVGIGAWAIGGDSQWGPSDESESIRTIHRARELGVTLLDTAPAYGLGHSEDVVGKALVGRRGDYVLATKCGLRWDVNEGSLLAERDGVRAAYNYAEFLPQRREMMQAWADYLDTLREGAVVIPFPAPAGGRRLA